MKKWYFPVAMLILAGFFVLFLFPGNLIDTRRIVLGTQFSGMITRAGPYFAVVFAVLLVTVLFGRLYCAYLCPAGLLQHLFTHAGKRLGLAKLGYRKPMPFLSYAIMAIVILYIVVVGSSFILGPMPGFAVLAQPLGDLLRHGTDRTARLFSEYPGYSVVIAVLAVLFVVIPLFRGRWFCNRLCPVGIVLGWANALPGQRFRIIPDKCVACGQCARACPVGCIDVANKSIESDRCVDCWDCENACRFDAVKKDWRPSPERRSFLSATAMTAMGGAYLLSRKIAKPGGLLAAADQPLPVVPPGSGGNDQHQLRCIACQACVPACPVGIIRPHRTRPVLDFAHGYCQYNCTECSRSCPAGAIRPIAEEEKHRTRLSRVRLQLFNCVVLTHDQHCGACAEVCPTHAVTMVEQEEGGPTIPDFDSAYCIGCGGCYHVCPAVPRAFTVQGLREHEESRGVREIQSTEPAREVNWDDMTDFPF